MIALLTSVALAAAMPVLPARKANELVATAAGKNPRPVVLHFWATWCEACRDEFPTLRPQLTGLPSRGVGVLLVSIDRPEDREKAEKMLADFRLLPVHAVLLDAPDPAPVARAVGEPTWDGTLPATFVFDEKGKLRKSFIGRADPNKLKTAVRAVMK
ncbi:MAG TPA: TlpA disulfide reductase family protein [Myxococcales bacterium]|nr:TlpA disulfide reductase family protein [Myxococcales bacterium]